MLLHNFLGRSHLELCFFTAKIVISTSLNFGERFASVVAVADTVILCRTHFKQYLFLQVCYVWIIRVILKLTVLIVGNR